MANFADFLIFRNISEIFSVFFEFSGILCLFPESTTRSGIVHFSMFIRGGKWREMDHSGSFPTQRSAFLMGRVLFLALLDGVFALEVGICMARLSFSALRHVFIPSHIDKNAGRVSLF